MCVLILSQYSRHDELRVTNNIVLPTTVPTTRYTTRAKQPNKPTRLNAMNGWTDEGRMRFQQLFQEVIQDRTFYGRSFNKRFATVLPRVTRKYAATTKANKRKDEANKRSKLMLLSDVNLQQMTNGAMMEQQICVEAQQLEQELIDVEDSDDEGDEQTDMNGTVQSTDKYNMATADAMQWHGDSLQTTAI